MYLLANICLDTIKDGGQRSSHVLRSLRAAQVLFFHSSQPNDCNKELETNATHCCPSLYLVSSLFS